MNSIFKVNFIAPIKIVFAYSALIFLTATSAKAAWWDKTVEGMKIVHIQSGQKLSANNLGVINEIPFSFDGNGQHFDTKYYLYLPRSAQHANRKLKVLVTIVSHEDYFYPKLWLGLMREQAEKNRMAIVAPILHPDVVGACWSLATCPYPSDRHIFDVLKDAEQYWKIETAKFYIFGHSRYGQVVQRFAMLHPDRIISGVASAGGSYAFPRPDVKWCMGVQKNDAKFFRGLKEANPDGFVQLHFGIFVGVLDKEDYAPEHITFQGKNTREVAQNMYRACREYAKSKNLPCNTRLRLIPNVGHNGWQIVPYALEYMFRYNNIVKQEIGKDATTKSSGDVETQKKVNNTPQS